MNSKKVRRRTAAAAALALALSLSAASAASAEDGGPDHVNHPGVWVNNHVESMI